MCLQIIIRIVTAIHAANVEAKEDVTAPAAALLLLCLRLADAVLRLSMDRNAALVEEQ